VSTHRAEDDIKAIHGIKFLNALMIFLCHKTVDSLIPSINRTKVAEKSSEASSIIVRVCALYTDVFLMLSGVLVAYSITNRLIKKQRISIVREYVARYMRIIPNIIAIMLATAYILPLLAQYTAHRTVVVDKPAELCRDYGWRNLLMIQNWFKFEEMCNLHSHHIGTDFELFLISPLLLTLLWRSPRRGGLLIFGLGLISTVLRFYVTYTKSLNYFVPFSAELNKLIETANAMYTLPTHRFTVYGFGLLLGFFLRKYNGIKLKTHHVLLGNAVSAAAFILIANSSVRMTGLNVAYDKTLHGLFAAFAPILACVPVAWIILASQNGHKSE
jgi:peptidoglycan/LPS O-acetylase OafA/YrhL